MPRIAEMLHAVDGVFTDRLRAAFIEVWLPANDGVSVSIHGYRRTEDAVLLVGICPGDVLIPDCHRFPAAFTF